MKALVKSVVCLDGFRMSVQASAFHYSTPRDDNGPYTELEVGFPSEPCDALMPYAEDADRPTNTVYGYVPVDIVKEVIREHGGLLSVHRLPPVVEN